MPHNSTQENQIQPTCIETQEVTPMNLIYKFTEMAIENRDAALIIAGAMGTSIIILAIGQSAKKLIRAVRG